MILRKPYAFFIKHFKLFNIILTILEIYIIYKLGFLFQFFLEYPKNPIGSIGQELVNTLLNNMIYIVIIGIIVFSSIILTVLSIKKKPKKLYIFTIIVNIAILVLMLITTEVLSTIETRIVDNRLIYGIRDFLLMGFILEFVITIFTLIRSIGLDVKNFKFKKDLEDMQIDVTDNEEFELQIDVDSSKFKRNVARNKRYFKYFVKEHKFSIILVATIILGITSYFIYSKAGIYFKTIKVDKIVALDNFNFGIGSSFVTNQDYRGNVITKNKLLVVPIKVSANNKDSLKTARFSLVIGNKRYYHDIKYRDRLIDFGTAYNDEVINKDFSNYILIFEIPKNASVKRAYLNYHTDEEKNVKFKIETTSLSETIVKETDLTKPLQLDDKIIGKGIVNIDYFTIDDKFRVDYDFCVTSNECYPSYEYLVPNFKSNYDKTLIKLVGSIKMETDTSITDLYDFINKFGTLVYTKDGKIKRTSSFSLVKPSHKTFQNTYYIEVLDDIKDAEQISLEFNLRNNKYVYKIR